MTHKSALSNGLTFSDDDAQTHAFWADGITGIMHFRVGLFSWSRLSHAMGAFRSRCTTHLDATENSQRQILTGTGVTGLTYRALTAIWWSCAFLEANSFSRRWLKSSQKDADD